MGLMWSLSENIKLNSTEEITETRPDGSKVVTKRDNPWVKGVIIVSSVVLMAALIDQGNGMFTKTLSRNKD